MDSGWRPGVPPKLTDDHLRALYQAHLTGVSIRELGRQIGERMGFASAKSAAVAISSGFKRLDFEARPRIEATVLASTTHGRAPRKGRDPGYKAWLRRTRGELRPPCAGVRQNHPRKGAPCGLPAMEGSDYCAGHDPALKAERDARLAAMRERIAA